MKSRIHYFKTCKAHLAPPQARTDWWIDYPFVGYSQSSALRQFVQNSLPGKYFSHQHFTDEISLTQFIQNLFVLGHLMDIT